MNFPFDPGRSQIAHLVNLLPCAPGDISYTNDRRGFEDLIERLHGGEASFEARNGVSFENAFAAVSHCGVDISLHACTDGKANFGARDKRTLSLYLAGSGLGFADHGSYSLSAGGEALVCSPEITSAEWSTTANVVITFDASALDEVGRTISGREAWMLPDEDIMVVPEIMVRNGWRDMLLGATRMAFEARSRPGFLSPANAADLVLRSIASLTMDALAFRERCSTASDGAQAVARVRAYMLDRLGYDMTLSELERVAGVSRRTLQSQFMRVHGVSPMRYLREERLKAAYGMLSFGKASVTEVALACGFTHMSQFSALFRARFGALPSEVARKRDQARG
ncbi:MAG: helix-turn-helix domain-containing protein [Beijerinckiaceae bacterium]